MNSRPIQIAVLVLLLAVGGMGLYAYRLMHRDQRRATGQVEMTEPASGPREGAVLMLASDKLDRLERRDIQTTVSPDPSLRARQLLRLLLAAYAAPDSPHPLPRSADVKQVFFVGPDLAVVDMNAAFADQHPPGAKEEQLTLESMLQTLAANFPQVKRVKILVEGRERQTLAGTADLSKTLTVSAGGHSR